MSETTTRQCWLSHEARLWQDFVEHVLCLSTQPLSTNDVAELTNVNRNAVYRALRRIEAAKRATSYISTAHSRKTAFWLATDELRGEWMSSLEKLNRLLEGIES